MKYLSLMVIFSLILTVNAKRLAPSSVKPVIHDGIEYSADRSLKKKGYDQKGGFLQAKNLKTKKILWVKAVYTIDYDHNLEIDVQDIYIASISVSKDKKHLVIIDERGRRFKLDFKTKKITAVKN